MSVLKISLLTATLLLTGCADTPENRQFWQQLGAGMQGAGDNLNRNAAQMRQNSATNSGNAVNCTTTNYGAGNSNTTCDGTPTKNMTCTTTNLGAGMARTTCY
jgi:hypothetical protein